MALNCNADSTPILKSTCLDLTESVKILFSRDNLQFNAPIYGTEVANAVTDFDTLNAKLMSGDLEMLTIRSLNADNSGDKLSQTIGNQTIYYGDGQANFSFYADSSFGDTINMVNFARKYSGGYFLVVSKSGGIRGINNQDGTVSMYELQQVADMKPKAFTGTDVNLPGFIVTYDPEVNVGQDEWSLEFSQTLLEQKYLVEAADAEFTTVTATSAVITDATTDDHLITADTATNGTIGDGFVKIYNDTVEIETGTYAVTSGVLTITTAGLTGSVNVKVSNKASWYNSNYYGLDLTKSV